MNNCKLCDCCENVMDFAYGLMEEASRFSILDWTMLKSCLVSFGILLGVTFGGFFKKIRPLMAIVFAVTFAYTVWRLFAPLFEELFEN